MPISSTSSVHWRWNETDLSQFGNQYNLGPVTGTISLEFKPATGSLTTPTLRLNISNAFRTPSGSLALIPINIDELPKNINLRFYVNNFSASNNIVSSNLRRSFRWGFLVNASSGSNREDYCGTFYGIPFSDAAIDGAAILPLNGGFVDAGQTSLASPRLLMSNLGCFYDFYIKHLSMTGSFFAGTNIENYFLCVTPDSTNVKYINKNTQYYDELHWSGSLFENKILNKIYLAVRYDVNSSYSPVTGAFVEIGNLQINKHPSGIGSEYQPPPITMSNYNGIQSPETLSNLTFYGPATSSLSTVFSGDKVVTFQKLSGAATQSFGIDSANAPMSSSLLINGSNFRTIHFSGGAYMTSSSNHGAYISASAFRVYVVANVITGSSNSATRYSNHRIIGDTGGWWGIYYRNNGNGSGTLDCYGWTSGQNTASVEFKFGNPFLIEYWRDSNTMYAKINNTLSISVPVVGAFSPNSGNPSTLGKTGDSTSQWHLLDLITSNGNEVEDIYTLGISNFLAQKYGIATSSVFTSIGGERW